MTYVPVTLDALAAAVNAHELGLRDLGAKVTALREELNMVIQELERFHTMGPDEDEEQGEGA